MHTYEEIIDKYDKRENQTDAQRELFERTFIGKSHREIKIALENNLNGFDIAHKLMEDSNENGGVIAISGFYYQFLNTIEYIVEMLEGKWTHVLIDHHQDIVVFNNEVIRMIQVKTKNVDTCTVSETELYRSWVPKLIESNNLFDELSSKKEFELITNFYPTNARSVEVEPYINNDEYDMKIETSLNDLVKEHYPDSSYSPQELDDYLKHFNISVKATEDYIGRIRLKIGSLFDESFVATDEDIYFIIGYICSKCYFPNNHHKQMIDIDEAEKLKVELKYRIAQRTKEATQKHDSTEYIEEYIQSIKDDFYGIDYFSDFSNILEEFESEMKQQQNEKHNLFSFLGKLVSRMSSSSKVNKAKPQKIRDWTKELLDIMLLLKCVYDCPVEIDFENDKLLIKTLQYKTFNTFNLDRTINFTNGRNMFLDALKNNSIAQKERFLRNGRVHVIFSGLYNKRDFPLNLSDESVEEISIGNYPSLKEFNNIGIKGLGESNSKFTTVTLEVIFINGHSNYISDMYSALGDYEDLDSYLSYLKNSLIGVDIN